MPLRSCVTMAVEFDLRPMTNGYATSYFVITSIAFAQVLKSTTPFTIAGRRRERSYLYLSG